MNKGKKFEKAIQESAKSQGQFLIRLNDTSLSWQNEKTSRFTPTNPCDFLCFKQPYLYAIEAKSTTGSYISIQRSIDENKAMIKAHQIKSLIEFSQHEGVFAGFILNFRNDSNIEDNVAYWMSIQNFSTFLAENDKKSINRLDCIHYGAIIIEQKLKRVNYVYNIRGMLDEIAKKEVRSNGTSV